MLKKGDPRIDSLLVVSASAFIPLLLVPGNIPMTFPRIIEVGASDWMLYNYDIPQNN